MTVAQRDMAEGSSPPSLRSVHMLESKPARGSRVPGSGQPYISCDLPFLFGKEKQDTVYKI